MRDNCRKCGRFLAKNNLIICDRCNKILSEWLRENLAKYSVEEMREIRHAWYEGKSLP